jgi:hypothetical protein
MGQIDLLEKRDIDGGSNDTYVTKMYVSGGIGRIFRVSN